MRCLRSISSPFRSILGYLSRRFNSSQFVPADRCDENHQLFNYTSGRWLYDEQVQLKRRYVKFNVQALKNVASQLTGTQCVYISKLPEGLFNKVLSLQLEDGHEVLARIPNPNAGNPRYVVPSDVATLDFVRFPLA